MTAFSALFRRGGSTLAVTVAEDWKPPALQAQAMVIGGSGPATPRLVSEVLGETTELTIPLQFTATTQTALKTAIDAVDTFLRGGTCTFEASFTDAAAATIWDVYHAQPLQPAFTALADLGHDIRTCTLTLTVSPFVRTAAAALYTAQVVTSPGYLALSGLTGNFKVPLTHTVASQTADDLHAVYLSLYSAATGLIFEAEDLTWSAGGTDFGDAAAHGANATKIASITAVTATIETNTLAAGPYLILAHVKANGAATGTISTDITAGRGVAAVTYTRTTWHLVELGECVLPSRAVQGAGTAPLVVSVTSSSADAGQEACIDYIYFVPLSRGMWRWHHGTAASDCDTIYHDAATGKTYVDDVADAQYTGGNTLMATSADYLHVISESADGDEATQAVEVSITAQGRWAWMR